MSVRSLFVTVLIAGFCVGLYAQNRNPGDLLRVQFSHDVVVGDKVLPAGPWDIYWDGGKTDPTLKLYHDSVFNAEVPAVLIGSEDNQKRPETEAVIEKIGSDYFLTNIWIKGERSGYAIRLLPQTIALRQGDVHHLPAKFVSASWFSQGAQMEGQARSHNAEGLGGPEGGHKNGVVIARAYVPMMPPTEVLVENRPSDVLILSEEGVDVLDTSNKEPTEIEPEPTILVQIPDPEPIVEDPVVALLVENNEIEVAEAVLAENNEPVEEEVTPVIALTEEEVYVEPIELAAVTEEEPIAEPPAEFQGLPDFLPATASNWAAFLLLGGALVGLALRIGRI